MKKTTSTMLAAAILFICASTSANAQTTGPERRPFGAGGLPEFLKLYDLDGDGKLSAEERQAFEKATREARHQRPGRFNPWDANKDGVLSDEEKQAARDAMPAKIVTERTHRFNELDIAPKDDYLTATELEKIPHITPLQVTGMIAHLDQPGTDGAKDGKISLAEFLGALKPVEPPFPSFPLPQPLPKLRMACHPLLKAFDAKPKDMMLSPEELAAMLTALDTSGDGKISLEEWETYLLAHPALLPPPGPGPQQ